MGCPSNELMDGRSYVRIRMHAQILFVLGEGFERRRTEGKKRAQIGALGGKAEQKESAMIGEAG